MQHLSPLVQLHDIVVQELENLALVTEDALVDLGAVAQAKAKDAEAPVSERLGLERRVRQARRRLTTASELNVLGSLSDSAGLDRESEFPSGGPGVASIELF